MKKYILPLSLFALSVSVVSCSSSTKTSMKAAKAEGYVTQSSGSFALKPYKEVTLENGLKVLFIPDNSLPRVSFTLLVKTGSLQESSADAGLNSLTANVMTQGTQTRSAVQIADEFGQIGSAIQVSPGSDMTMFFTDSLSNSKDQALNLLADIVMNPSFKDGEVQRIRSQMVASLKKKVDNPSNVASDRFDEMLFATHPYGRDTSGTEAALKALSKQSLIKHFLAYYRPNNASLAVVGQFPPDFETQVREVFGKWSKRNLPAQQPAVPKDLGEMEVKVITKKGLQQAQIRIGALGIARSDADYLTLRLANEILGGSFASRLNQKIRDDQGLTYSIYSGFDTKLQRGSFEISTFTKNDSVGKTLEETLKVVNEFVEKGATEKELQAAKSQLIGQFPRAIETADRLAFNLLALDVYGVAPDYLTRFNDSVQKAKLADVNEVIKKRIDPKKFQVLIYADNSVVKQIEDLKLVPKLQKGTP